MKYYEKVIEEERQRTAQLRAIVLKKYHVERLKREGLMG